MKALQLRLETLSCPSCVKRIESSLNKEDGIQDARVLFHSSKVKLNYNDDLISQEKIREHIEQLGFKVLH